MKLVKNQVVEKPILNKRYLIPSILAMGFVPLIMHEHTYRTHLENEEWFAVGNYTATDFFLFWKQWSIIIIALVCLLLLLIRAKYYKEKLPWEKKAFIPLIVYCIFVFLSACFADKPLFAFAGGYDMFQSSLCLLSYVVIFYYTYSCIKSMDHVLYLLRNSEWFVLIELVICFSQAVGHDLIATKVGKILVTSPSRWKNLDSLTLAPTMYGTVYHNDYLSSYYAVLVPIIIALLIIEKKKWRKCLDLAFLGVIAFIQPKAASSERIAVFMALIIGFLIICTRSWKILVSCLILYAVCIGGAVNLLHTVPYLGAKAQDAIMFNSVIEDDAVTISYIKTGSSKEGITVKTTDNRELRFKFSFDKDNKVDLKAWDGSGNPLQLNLVDENAQRYYFADPTYASDMQFVVDTSKGIPCLNFVKDWNWTFPFTTINTETGKSGGYYYLSSAGRTVKLPQKKVKKVHLFTNGFLNNRGYIWDKSIPLLPHHMIIGAGADNFIMEFTQRDYVWDKYYYGDSNSLNVKPHEFYLQMWIEEGFIALVALLIFFGWFVGSGVRRFRKTSIHDDKGVMGLGVTVGVIGYLISMLANDSFTSTTIVFWVILGMGLGIYRLDDVSEEK